MKKRITALLLCLVMALSLVPATVWAAGEGTIVTPRGSEENPIWIYDNRAEDSYGSVSVPVGKTITDAGVLTFCAHSIQGTEVSIGTGFLYCTITSSDESVVKATGGWQGGNMVVNFEGISDGTATVTVDYSCNGSKGAAALGNLIYNVTVGNGGTTDPSGKPNKPTSTDAKKFRSNGEALTLECIDKDNAGNKFHSAAFDYLTDGKGGYSVGEVKENDGKLVKKDNYLWMCEMTVTVAPYLAEFNDTKGFGKTYGQHYLAAGQSATATIHWFYRTGGGWEYLESAPLRFKITKNAPATQDITLTYDANNGIGAPDPVTKQADANGEAKFDISATVPTRDGYDFLGWADTNNATAAQYSNPAKTGTSDSLTISASKTIYAVWQQDHQHDWEYVNNGDGTHTGNCKDPNCNATTDVNEPHADGNNDGKCDKCGADMPTPPLDTPQPKKEDFASLNLFVECKTNIGSHERKAVPYSAGTYDIDWTKGSKTCTLIFNPAGYVEYYSNNFGYGKHTAVANQVARMTCSYNSTKNEWKVDDISQPVIQAECETTPAKEYRVRLQIYRNGDTTKAYKTVNLGNMKDGTIFDLSTLDIETYYPTSSNSAGKYDFYGWYNDGLWAQYKKAAPGKEPAGLNKFKISGYTDFRCMVYDYEYVRYFQTADDLKAYQKDNTSTKGLLHSTVVRAGTVLPVDAPTTTRTGYTFKCWSLAGETSDVTGQTVAGETNLYALWQPIEYEVTFDPNGGETPSFTRKTVKFGSKYYNLPTTSREGYTFDGWFTAADGGQKVTKTTVVKTADNHTLYAHWTPKTDVSYTVKYVHKDKGTELAAEKVVTGQTFDTTVTENAAAITGYKADAPTTKTLKLNGYNKELVFYYTPEVYTINYVLRDGKASNNPANPATYTVEDTVTLQAPTTKRNNQFLEWRDEKGNVITEIAAGTTGNVKVYAYWKCPIKLYEFTANGKVQLDNTIYVPEGTSYTLPDGSVYAKNGYTFKCWYETEGNLTANKNQKTAVTPTVTKEWKLYGKNIPIEYTITYVLNDKDAKHTNQTTYTVEDAFEITNATNGSFGRKFLEWRDADSKTGNKVTKIEKDTTGNITLYAIWQNPVNYFQVDKDGNETLIRTDYVTVHEDYQTIAAIDKAGYTFDGWYKSTKDFGADSKKVTDFTATNSKAEWKLYGKLTPNANTPYVVEHYQEQLDGTYKRVETEKLTGTTDTTATAAAKKYDHFTYDSTVSGTLVSGTITGDGKLALKLYYTRNIYTVTFESNGGSAINSRKVKYEQTLADVDPIGSSFVPTKSGNTFAGWYTDKELKNAFKFDTGITGSMTLYAKWDPAKAVNTTPGGNNIGPAKNPYIKDTTKTDGKTVKSGNTFDAGIALYAGLGFLSLTGSAVAIFKQRREYGA